MEFLEILVDQIIREADRLFGINIRNEMLVTYKFEECTELTAEQVLDMLNSERVFSEMESIADASNYLSKIYTEDGWYIHIVTDRDKTFHDLTYRRLNKNRYIWNE